MNSFPERKKRQESIQTYAHLFLPLIIYHFNQIQKIQLDKEKSVKTSKEFKGMGDWLVYSSSPSFFAGVGTIGAWWYLLFSLVVLELTHLSCLPSVKRLEVLCRIPSGPAFLELLQAKAANVHKEILALGASRLVFFHHQLRQPREAMYKRGKKIYSSSKSHSNVIAGNKPKEDLPVLLV